MVSERHKRAPHAVNRGLLFMASCSRTLFTAVRRDAWRHGSGGAKRAILTFAASRSGACGNAYVQRLSKHRACCSPGTGIGSGMNRVAERLRAKV